MKVVALVSGGKDSCYAMQRCVHYGHQIVALANLLPADDGVDELDSFMYQTVGHQMICAIAQCMGLPLYRRRIQGTSRLQEMRYKKTKGDEVEDLENLLLAVKQKHPEVQAVSSGAIASNYQRLRIESICSRLGLISLAYMWEQDQAALLQNMIDSGIHAVLVKVAAIGMDPHKHLGKDLASLQPHLTRLASMYGSNVCGEGGEYESLTLDSPLYKRARIHLDEFDIILHSPDQIAPVGVLHPTKFHLEPKDDASSTADLSSDYLVFEVTENAAAIGDSLQNPSPKLSLNDQVQVTLMSQRHGFVTVGCWRQHCEKLGVQEELGLLLSTVESSLERQGLSWGNVVYVRLFLEDMASFGLANEVYVKHITEQKCERGVPSRCCMQVCLLEAGMGGALVEVLAASDCEKRVLHVQSISCWAPSCIGPYSQATLHRNILHMAGQLGLDPPTMALVAGGSTLEMQQAMENCEAVAGAFKVGLRGDAIAFNIYCSAVLSAEDRAQVERCLHQFLEADSADDDDSDDVRKDPRISNPLILFVLVPALPKGALVEVEPSLFVDSDTDSTWQHLQIESPSTQCCRALVLPQRYARAMTCIRSTSAKEESLTSLSLNKSDGQELEETVLQAVTTLKHRIFEAAAKLSWSDITTFRVYYDAKAVAAAPLRAVLAQALEKVKEEGEEVVAPTLIPTCEASSSLLLNRERNLLVLDVTAAAGAAGATHNQL